MTTNQRHVVFFKAYCFTQAFPLDHALFSYLQMSQDKISVNICDISSIIIQNRINFGDLSVTFYCKNSRAIKISHLFKEITVSFPQIIPVYPFCRHYPIYNLPILCIINTHIYTQSTKISDLRHLSFFFMLIKKKKEVFSLQRKVLFT